MFCPVCRAEYRTGFTRCADCGVDLVASLSKQQDLAGANALASAETVEVLWAGIDPRTCRTLSDALERADIEYDDEPLQSQLLPAMRGDMHEIRVRKADFAAANKVLADLWGGNADEGETPSAALLKASATVNPFHFDHPVYNHVPDNEAAKNEPEPEEDDGQVPEDDLENFDPEAATVVVWTGEDAQMAVIFKECLSNVGIGCVVNEKNGSVMVLVMPAAEKRGREVVREIEEGTPME
jgi:hypothetical protein